MIDMGATILAGKTFLNLPFTYIQTVLGVATKSFSYPTPPLNNGARPYPQIIASAVGVHETFDSTMLTLMIAFLGHWTYASACAWVHQTQLHIFLPPHLQ